MKPESVSKAGRHESRNPVITSEVWVVSANGALLEKIEEILSPFSRIRVLAPAAADGDLEGTLREGGPPLIVIDIGDRVDWGMRVIQTIKRAHIQTSTVILTERFSRDFGMKILSEGISYYFPYDFCHSEFLQLVTSILKVDEKSRKGEIARGRKIKDRKDPVV